MALNINGTTGISGVDASVSAPALTGTDSNTGISFPAADTIKFSTGGVERISITNSGISGTGISSGGITQADIYRLHTTINATYNSVDVITSNWERPDETNDVFDKIGSGMSESSGIFTFPATGIYLVNFIARWYGNGNTSGANHIYMDATLDNANYTTVAQSAAYTGNSYQATVIAQTMIDITDVSNRKMRFKRYAGGSNQQLLGNTAKNETFITFIRLGDT